MAKPLETFLTEPGTVLAFDFGLARTGVAVGNTVTRTAEPLVILVVAIGHADHQEPYAGN